MAIDDDATEKRTGPRDGALALPADLHSSMAR